MMYVAFIVDNIHYLLNEGKIWIFAYICDRGWCSIFCIALNSI